MSDIKLQRTITRFKARIDSGDYYEAHQTLRTITNRYLKSKQFSEAIDLLIQGSTILSQNKQYASSSDLITYLIQVYQEANVQCDKDHKLKLIELINLLPDTDPSLPDLSKQSINWSIESGASKYGDNALHDVLGVKLLRGIQDEANTAPEEEKLKVFSFAELHLILGTHDSLAPYVKFLYSWYKNQKEIEDPGVFLARAVFNYAYLKNLNFVNQAIDVFLSQAKHDGIEGQQLEQDATSLQVFEQYPLLNFLQLTAITLLKDSTAGDRYLKLFHHYEQDLKKHGLSAPAEYIGQFYFKLKLGNSQGGQNMLANLMGGLFK